jgi:hypothetical protein
VETSRQRLGTMSKQGNTLLRYLWCEAAMHAVEGDPELKRFHRRKLVQKGLGKARVAAARKLGIRLWIMSASHHQSQTEIPGDKPCSRHRSESQRPVTALIKTYSKELRLGCGTRNLMDPGF